MTMWFIGFHGTKLRDAIEKPSFKHEWSMCLMLKCKGYKGEHQHQTFICKERYHNLCYFTLIWKLYETEAAIGDVL